MAPRKTPTGSKLLANKKAPKKSPPKRKKSLFYKLTPAREALPELIRRVDREGVTIMIGGSETKPYFRLYPDDEDIEVVEEKSADSARKSFKTTCDRIRYQDVRFRLTAAGGHSALLEHHPEDRERAKKVFGEDAVILGPQLTQDIQAMTSAIGLLQDTQRETVERTAAILVKVQQHARDTFAKQEKLERELRDLTHELRQLVSKLRLPA
ncbi:hypothetical protein DES45_1195 [Microvirga subterranea]|uniref:Uncharacterized protein n=2 Tax=Microvirga subterranea TaxID=186651 RepID=A0A370H5Y0_9HYPH|nr:hypothetical protein DES45_1195 [Microvirga subterranea]